MRTQKAINSQKFIEVFTKLGWRVTDGESNKYKLVTHPDNSDIWSIIPNDPNSAEQKYYSDKNLKLLLYFLGLEDNPSNLDDLHQQLIEYNYKLFNRFVNNEKYTNEYVPFELAQEIPLKVINTFRYYFLTMMKGKKNIPIENFTLSHTQSGSFVIPVSIKASVLEGTLLPMASETLIAIQKYLDTVDRLLTINTNQSPQNYAKNVVDNEIDSKIVKSYMSDTEGIAKIKLKYEEQVSEITIFSKYNPILDIKELQRNPLIKEVSLGNTRPLTYDYINSVEQLEIEKDDRSISLDDVRIDVLTDSVDRTGVAKLTVLAINGDPVDREFKARSQELTKANLDKLAGSFITGQIITITGDISKSKGKIGKIVAGDLTLKPSPRDMFNDPQ